LRSEKIIEEKRVEKMKKTGVAEGKDVEARQFKL